MGRDPHGDAIAPQRDGHGTDGSCGVMDEIASCSEQLREFCGGQAWSVADEGDDDTDSHSAAEIASECLALLESLSVTADDDDGSVRSMPLSPVRSHSTETALLREINDLGGELEALMTALCSPTEPECIASAEDSTVGPDSEGECTAADERPESICTSPKMVALTKRLERRPSTQRMLVHTALRRHKSFPLGLKSPSPSLGKSTKGERDGDRGTKSETRVLLSDAAFWRQYQSKSFQRHLSRQSQARAIQQREKANESKAIEYRYRRVAKPCYPLAKTTLQRRHVEGAATPGETVVLPVASERPKKSYTDRFHSVKHGSEVVDAREDDGLLCGVYLHGKRRSHGMLYLTCTSLDQLKMRVAKKFSLAQPVVNLYREQVATDLGGARERKYLHRVVQFDELRDGDLLCATTDGYDDMAILCAWMKKRQQLIHNYKSPQRPRVTQASKADATTRASKPVQKSTPHDSLAYKKPPPPPQVKLWDENGRLVSISHRLPLEE